LAFYGDHRWGGAIIVIVLYVGLNLRQVVLKCFVVKCTSETYTETVLLAETKTFFTALGKVGTDFTMMTLLLPKRSRKELKVGNPLAGECRWSPGTKAVFHLLLILVVF